MRVKEAFIITLPERSDRRETLQQRLDRAEDWPFPAPAYWDGVRERSPDWFRSSNGAWGCRQAHLKLLRQQWTRGIDSTLVLEDDVIWSPGLAARWNTIASNIPSNWDMIMLGGEHIAPPTIVDSHVVRTHNTRRTHAYIVRLKAIPLLIRTWEQARRHIDHALTDFQHNARVYAVDPFLLGQDAGHSDISTQHNPDVRYWSRPADTSHWSATSITALARPD